MPSPYQIAPASSGHLSIRSPSGASYEIDRATAAEDAARLRSAVGIRAMHIRIRPARRLLLDFAMEPAQRAAVADAIDAALAAPVLAEAAE
ncbi:hypothetical protein ACFOGJ_09010 [Marinibaculum pumilum]|uniref:Cation transporter n=1 Tax=Marinibaculum pumilum TaxID=1766165 RepID=A0ABV7KYI7_9PROT